MKIASFNFSDTNIVLYFLTERLRVRLQHINYNLDNKIIFTSELLRTEYIKIFKLIKCKAELLLIINFWELL